MPSTVISSAVVIPEQSPVQEEPPSLSLKRRQSSQSLEGDKRLRLDSNHGTDSRSAPQPPSATSPPRRKSSIVVGGAEEKKRGQRLFGSLLGTLSQVSSKPTIRKRDEIEKRQQERMRQDQEEREEERKQRKQELDTLRTEEQKVWVKESTKLRHRNQRAMTGFLRTKTEPPLYYRPWELRTEEEETLKRQKVEVEQIIKKEQENGFSHAETAPVEPVQEESVMKEEGVVVDDQTTQPEDEIKKKLPLGDGGTEKEGNEDPKDRDANDAPPIAEDIVKSPTDEKPKEEDHGGEELVEGHEDDVIY